MAWRGLHIANPGELSRRNGQLVVKQDDGEATFPVEDIAWIVLDTPQLTISAALLGTLAESGVALIVVDGRHHPAGILLSFHQHHAQAAIAHSQIAMSQPLKKRLWQRLVVAKIENQAAMLRSVGRDEAQTLSAMTNRVASGDPDNIEAQAARLYWSALFERFKRHDDDRRNALLDYGYAVVRAALARACTASGLLPAFGIHHASRTNAFNLVDDLIEPFRPVVDRLAHRRERECEGDTLSVDDRRVMAGVLTETIAIGAESLTVLAATEAVAVSLVRAMDCGRADALAIPVLPLARRT